MNKPSKPSKPATYAHDAEAGATIFNLSLGEWQKMAGIQCSCRGCRGVEARMAHEPTCDVIASVEEWRAECHAAHERIRGTFPRLIGFKDGWARESDETMKTRRRREAEAAS